MTETYSLSRRELRRVEVLGRVDGGLLTAREAGELLGLSVRQVRRILAAYREGGAAALAHGNRGRKPAHATKAEARDRVIELARTKYVDYNHQHLSEVLEGEGVKLSRPTVRRILLGVGLKSPRKRRAPKHRQRRERYAQEGMLIQVDGSDHDWLEGRGRRLTLVAGVDDATGKIVGAVFRRQEDAQGYFLVLGEIVRRYGVPLALYHDRHGIFERSSKEPETLDEQLAGRKQPTQFGRALEELGVASIDAHSPQAKGRIERLFGTLQDRLVKALREAGASTVEDANLVLKSFRDSFNARFAVEPAESGQAYRELPKDFDLDGILCFKYQRVVAKDNTVRFGVESLQILPDQDRSSYARLQVEVQERLDGSLAVYLGGKRLGTREAPKEVRDLRARRARRPNPPDQDVAAGWVGGANQAEARPRAQSQEALSANTTRAGRDSECAGQTDQAPGLTSTSTEPSHDPAISPHDQRQPPPIDKWTGKPITRTTPSRDHPWRTPFKQPRVTESLNP